VARLHNVRPDDDAALVVFGEQHAGLPAEMLRAILALESHPEQSEMLLKAPEFMNAYLLAAETLWAFVDKWRS